MKATAVMFLLFFAAFAWAGETPDPVRGEQFEPAVSACGDMAITRSPALKRKARGQGAPSARVVIRALRMFKSAQNKDGSWGEGGSRHLATPLVLTALLGNGESRTSHEFGQAVTRAREWTLAAEPATDAERASAIVALSFYVAMHANERRDNVKAEIAKIGALLSALKNPTGDPWSDLLAFHRLPDEIERPGWMKDTRDKLRKWSETDVDANPTTLDGYIVLRVAGLAKFLAGGKPWVEFNRDVVPVVVSRQAEDGYYPSALETDRFACTALAVQSLQMYYVFSGRFWALPEREPAPARVVIGYDIDIDVAP